MQRNLAMLLVIFVEMCMGCDAMSGGPGGDRDGSMQGPDGGGQSGANRYSCPIDKPQKVYGYAPNAKVTLTSDETWSPDNVYLVFGPLEVSAVLTIEAGTVVCFTDGPPGAKEDPNGPPGELDIEQSGTLKALGTPTNKVIFAQKDTGTYWGGVYYASGANTAESTLQNVDFYNAGLSAASPPIATFPDETAAPLDLQNVTFYSLQRKGLAVLGGGFTAASRVRVNNFAEETPESDFYQYPVLRIHPFSASTVDATVFTVGDLPAPTRYIQLDHAAGALLGKNVTLHKLAGDLRWRNTENMTMAGDSGSPATLTLDPGVKLAVNRGNNIRIGDNSSSTRADLVAVGTESDPIVFTSDAFIDGRAAAPGDWAGIEFVPGNFSASVSKLSYVTLEYGGETGSDTIYNCNDNSSDVGAEIVFGTSLSGQDYDGPSISHVTFSNSSGEAIRDRCNVNHTGGCLKTDYAANSLGNTFTAISESPPVVPLTCP